MTPSFESHQIVFSTVPRCLCIIEPFISLFVGLFTRTFGARHCAKASGYSDEHDSPHPRGHYSVGDTNSSTCVTDEPPASDVGHTVSSHDLAPFSWQAGDSNNTLKDICDKPERAPRCKSFPSIHAEKTLEGGSGDLF